MITFFKKSARFIYIVFIFMRYRLDAWLWLSPEAKRLKWLRLFFPWRWFRPITPPSGEELRQALEQLGPIFVKVGQLLSIRRDFLPEDIANALAKLQDQVTPFDSKTAMTQIENAFKRPLSACFATVDPVPLGSASIAQVHPATLLDGTEVVIKVLRPGVHEAVAQDMALLETLAYLLHVFLPDLRRFQPKAVIAEIKTTLQDELDLTKEAANASQLRRNFEKSNLLKVPRIYWDFATPTVLVMERIYGVPISDMATFKEKGVNLKKLAENGVEIFFTQAFRDCFFHADMHPGNVFVNIDDPQNPQYCAVDFGIMGTLSPTDQRYLAENFSAFFNRDYRKIATLHVASGWVSPDTRIEAFEAAIRTVCEPIFEKPLKDISLAQTLIHLFQTARRFNMEVQPQLVLLQKTLLAIEGLGHQLYPELDLWQTAKPFLAEWMKKRYGFRAFRQLLKTKLPVLSTQLPELPEAINEISRYLQQRHAPKQTKSNNTSLSRVLGVSLALVSLALGWQLYEHSATPNLLETLQPLMVLGGLGLGLFCTFKVNR